MAGKTTDLLRAEGCLLILPTLEAWCRERGVAMRDDRVGGEARWIFEQASTMLYWRPAATDWMLFRGQSKVPDSRGMARTYIDLARVIGKYFPEE